MYRFWLFVCYCFLYRPNLFQAHIWTGLNLYSFPRHRESEHVSLFAFPSSSSSHQHLISCLRSPVTSFPKPHVVARPLVKPCCEALTRPQALSVLTLGLILKVRDWSHYCSLNCCILDLLSTAQRQNGSKLFAELGPFLPVHWKRNVTWSYAEK